jgi:hypothetical protein
MKAWINESNIDHPPTTFIVHPTASGPRRKDKSLLNSAAGRSSRDTFLSIKRKELPRTMMQVCGGVALPANVIVITTGWLDWESR